MNKILIIEDNYEVRDNLAEILELSGYEIITAENGVEGVSEARNQLPDLILCDVMMPELDGYGVLKILNGDPQLMRIPFMFLTAKADKQDFRKGMGLGADDYITKPFDDVELLEAIEIRLKKSKYLKSISSEPESVRQFIDQSLAEKAVDSLKEGREAMSFPAKYELYREGEFPKYLYYVVEGSIKSAKSSDHGKELITKVHHRGQFVGILSALSGEKYNEHALVLEDAMILLIPIEDFRFMMYNDRDLSAKFLHILADKAEYTEERLLDLAFSSVRKKVSKALVDYAENMQADTFTITRDDLAAMAGTARETTIRTLSDFKAEKLIDIQGKKIILVDKNRLSELPQ